MYEVRNRYGVAVEQSEKLSVAKMFAEDRKKKTGLNYTIYEVKQVWTTQTLDEAVKEQTMQYAIAFTTAFLSYMIGYMHGYNKAMEYANEKLDDLIHYSKYEQELIWPG